MEVAVKETVVYGYWCCDRCWWVKSLNVKYDKPVDWIRWSGIAANPPKHNCPQGGKPQLRSVQWVEE